MKPQITRWMVPNEARERELQRSCGMKPQITCIDTTRATPVVETLQRSCGMKPQITGQRYRFIARSHAASKELRHEAADHCDAPDLGHQQHHASKELRHEAADHIPTEKPAAEPKSASKELRHEAADHCAMALPRGGPRPCFKGAAA